MIPATNEDIVRMLIWENFPGTIRFFMLDSYPVENRLDSWKRFKEILIQSIYMEAQKRYKIDGEHYRLSCYGDITQEIIEPVVAQFLTEFKSWLAKMKGEL